MGSKLSDLDRQQYSTHWDRDKNGRHFLDGISKCIFVNENVWISIKISPNFVSKGPTDNIPALVQILARCLPGDKPLFWTNAAKFTDAFMRQSASMRFGFPLHTVPSIDAIIVKTDRKS